MSASLPGLAPEHAIGLAVAGAIGFALAGCGGDGGDDSEPLPPAITIDTLHLAVTTDVDTDLDVIGTADAAGITRASSGSDHRATMALDGEQLPRDPGADRGTLALGFALSDADGGAADCHVVINPAHGDVVATAPDDFAARKHLLDRSGIGATWDEIEAAMGLPYEQVVDELVDGMRSHHHQPVPHFMGEPILSWRERGALSPAQRQAVQDRINGWNRDLRVWWHREILTTPSPLTERMVLFWHGVWTSSLDATPYPHLMYRQQQVLRTWGIENFAELARRLPKDPAMVLYLDSDSNVVGAPNENFARELLELFSLGEGEDYDEADIPEIARCFTGYGLTDHFDFEFEATKHDHGDKAFFGLPAADRDGDDVIDLILGKRRCAEYLCERLVVEFLGREADGQPHVDLVADLTDIMFPDYAIKPVLKALFKHPQFTTAARRGTRVRSPVELILGTYRRVGLDFFDDPSPWTIIWRHSSCDHSLLYPPNVRGWPDGTRWIDAKTFLARRQQMKYLGWSLDGELPEHLASGLQDLLLSVDPVGTIDDRDLGRHFRSILTDAAYQVG